MPPLSGENSAVDLEAVRGAVLVLLLLLFSDWAQLTDERKPSRNVKWKPNSSTTTQMFLCRKLKAQRPKIVHQPQMLCSCFLSKKKKDVVLLLLKSQQQAKCQGVFQASRDGLQEIDISCLQLLVGKFPRQSQDPLG